MVGFWSLLLMATLCIGGYYCWYHWMITTRCFEEPTRITIEELAQGRFPKNCYVTITDPVLLPNAGVELRDDRTFKPWRQYWAPLTSRTEALAGAEPRAKLVLYYKQYVFSKDLQMLLDRSEFTGLVLYKVTTVDGHALDLMSRIYPEVNDEDVLVFEIGEEPMSRYLLYPLMALLAIVSALIAVPIVSWLRRSPNDEM